MQWASIPDIRGWNLVVEQYGHRMRSVYKTYDGIFSLLCIVLYYVLEVYTCSSRMFLISSFVEAVAFESQKQQQRELETWFALFVVLSLLKL